MGEKKSAGDKKHVKLPNMQIIKAQTSYIARSSVEAILAWKYSRYTYNGII